MSDTYSIIAAAVEKRGTAAIARVLEVSRGALLSYVAHSARQATTIVIEQRADRLRPRTSL